MVLNYLDDAVAIAGVIYVYKTPVGAMRAIQLFEDPTTYQ
jgi:hypothetical protein